MTETPTELIRAREARGLTISALAAQIGVSRQAIYKWERGETKPNRIARKVLAATLFIAPEVIDSWFNKAA